MSDEPDQDDRDYSPGYWHPITMAERMEAEELAWAAEREARDEWEATR